MHALDRPVTASRLGKFFYFRFAAADVKTDIGSFLPIAFGDRDHLLVL